MKQPNNPLSNTLGTHTQSLVCLLFFLMCCYSSQLFARSVFSHNPVSALKFQDAAQYTALHWQPTDRSLVAIKLLPTLNYSGIPMDKRDVKADYFNHGKIPMAVADLFADLLNSSHYFSDREQASVNPDYEFQLTIDQYQLPFAYHADDIWWQEINGKVDRWMAKPQPSSIKLTLSIFDTYSRKRILLKSIRTTLSQCDLNSHIQRLSWQQNKNPVLNEYIKTTPGQTFIAASNFLILEAIHIIEQQRKRALVADKFENEILIIAENSGFKVGQKLDIYQRTRYPRASQLPIGQVQIIKTYNHQAIAYPINFRNDQLIQGDWLDVKSSTPFKAPTINYLAKNQCSQVPVTELY